MNITDRRFLLLFSLMIVVWVIVYQEALLGMEAIWARSDTFAHGYFILPISIWLLWRDRENLLISQVKSTWLPLPILAVSLFVWLFSYAASINVLGQLSAVVSLICIIWLMVGNKIAWRYKFPLAYLVFAVPMGENLIPWLQDVTAWFTVFFLKLNGIPVFVDGLYIQIPTGMFEVAVACSGIRYLIASIAVGTLFAYLTYHKTYKQITFILFSIFLPILANGIRAYGIVAIAYYSDMEYATGADHLIYGWLFFGIIMMLMFWVGGLFADKELETSSPKPQTEAKYNFTKGIGGLLLIFGAMWLTYTIPVTKISGQPSEILAGEKVEASDWGITFYDGIGRSYIIDEDNIETVVASYANRQTKGELISSKNVLFNPEKWAVIKSNSISEISAKFVVLKDRSGNERSILFRYVVGGYNSSSKIEVKSIQAWHSLFRYSSSSYIEAVSISRSQNLNNVEEILIEALGNIRRIE